VKKFGEIRSSNPRVYVLRNDNFAPILEKSAYHAKYLTEYPGPIFTNFTYLVGIWVRTINLICIAVAQGRCYGNQLNMGAILRHRYEGSLLFALAFDNGFDDRPLSKRFNGNNPATPCTNLMSFRPII